MQQDICVELTTETKAKSGNFPHIKFRFWLNINFEAQFEMKYTKKYETELNNLQMEDFLPSFNDRNG